jgi:hypothetical protein
MRPLAQADGHDAPRLIDELVPSEAAVIDDIIVGLEDAVGEPVVAHELPEVLDRVQLWAFGRQRQEGDVGRDHQCCRGVPSRLIEDQDGMGAGGDMEGDLCEMHPHGLTVAAGHDDRRPFALGRAGGPEDVGRGRALILGG